MPFVKISVSISLKFTHPTQLARERDPAAKELAQICRVVVHEIFQILWLADLESDHLAGLVRRSGRLGRTVIVAGLSRLSRVFSSNRFTSQRLRDWPCLPWFGFLCLRSVTFRESDWNDLVGKFGWEDSNLSGRDHWGPPSSVFQQRTG